MQPVATFSGLASGIDTKALIDQLVKVENIPVQALQQKQSDYNSMSSRLSKIKDYLNLLNDAATALNSQTTALPSKGSSSDDKVVSITANGAAAIGSYDVQVTRLATAQRSYSDAVASRDAAGLFGTGSFSIQVGSDAAVDIAVGPGDTLDDVLGKINASSARVNASIVFDGTQYRLQVSGRESGSAQAVTFVETGVTLGLSTPANTVVAAQDALFSVDGIAMQRSTNTVADAIAGVSMQLRKTTTVGNPVGITVERDPNSLADKVQTFVDAYNKVMTTVNGEFAYTGVARVGDSLSGDGTLRNLQSALRSKAIGAVDGLSSQYTTLASIGVRANSDGTLKVDKDALVAAANKAPQDVAALFVGNPDASIDGLMKGFSTVVDQYTDASSGLLSLSIKNLAKRVTDADDQISALQRRIDKYQTQLQAQFAAMETLISGLQTQGSSMLAVLNNLSNSG